MTNPARIDLARGLRELADRLVSSQPPCGSGQPVAFLYARASKDDRVQGYGRSVESQIEDQFADAARRGWYVRAIFMDNNLSASPYATKERPEFEAMVGRIRRGECDIVAYWEASRSTRDLALYAELRKTSRELGVRWFYNGTLFDLDNYDDRFRTALDIVLAEREVDLLSARVRKGITKAARAGLPHGGPAPYGYVRLYDPHTREFVAQQPDLEPRWAVSADGQRFTYSKAMVAAYVIKRIAGGDSCHRLMRALNHAGVLGFRDGLWTARHIRLLALNPTYAGWRVLRGQKARRGVWPALVSDGLHEAAVRRLKDPRRRTSRDCRAKYLLSYLAVCVCGAPLGIGRGGRKASDGGAGGYMQYNCKAGRCTSIRVERLDAYVEAVLIERLSDPAALDWLVRPDDHEAFRAGEEAAEVRAQLQQWNSGGA
ncbi:recombinase family protein [Longispora albida]|uniref:recombinase family protein n=1 Tax=Longispora albida TaxID=203523 RepID=UPI00039CF11B|nr:recombinase family protein [Longispora albida]